MTKELVEKVLGPPKFVGSDASERILTPGAAAGLVWTAAGGLVQYVECCCVSKGHAGRLGQLTLTGQVRPRLSICNTLRLVLS